MKREQEEQLERERDTLAVFRFDNDGMPSTTRMRKCPLKRFNVSIGNNLQTTHHTQHQHQQKNGKNTKQNRP
jgi:hypothetical protein